MSDITQYWLTSHNPHVGSSLLEWDLYLRPKDRSAQREPQAGDKVLIYEQRSGKVDRQEVSGGRGGIVASAEVRSGWAYRSAKNEFELEAKLKESDYTGFLSRSQVNKILGYERNYTFHGFGGGSGLLRISEEEFTTLRQAFKMNARD